jgi:hypothetical protein
MPRWLTRALPRIRELAADRRVVFTLKARRELAGIDCGLDEEDACDLLVGLTERDSAGRLISEATGEWMYVFKPTMLGLLLYVKVILRDDCVLISFHEDDGGLHDEED